MIVRDKGVNFHLPLAKICCLTPHKGVFTEIKVPEIKRQTDQEFANWAFAVLLEIRVKFKKLTHMLIQKRQSGWKSNKTEDTRKSKRNDPTKRIQKRKHNEVQKGNELKTITQGRQADCET